MWWNVVLALCVLAAGVLDLSSVHLRVDRVTRPHDVARCILQGTTSFAGVFEHEQRKNLDLDAAGWSTTLVASLVDCVELGFNASSDLLQVARVITKCVAAPLAIPQDPSFRGTLAVVVHYCVLTRGAEHATSFDNAGWYIWHTVASILLAILVYLVWPASVYQRWKPIAWLVGTIAVRIATAVLVYIPLSDLLALSLHFVSTGWLHALFGVLAILVFCAGVAFYRHLPKRLHQEIDIDLQHPDRAPIRSSEIRPKWWAVFEEATPNPRVDRGPLHRRTRPEALFGVQPQFADPQRSAAVVATRLDSGDYRHIGVCFRIGDKGVSVLHNLLAGGHDLNAPDFTNLVVLHNNISATIGEFHTLGPMKQGRNKGEVITFKWPIALDQVRPSRIVVSPTPASQLMILTLDRNGRGDRYKLGGANKVSYDKGEYIYHFDTHAGDSGSPLFDESGAVRAIHYGGSGRGNVGIAFVPENFPTFKDYLQTPWGQVADMAEPRGEPVHHESVPPVVISTDCCDGQRVRHAQECGCAGEGKCMYTKRCPFHNESVPTGPKQPEKGAQKRNEVPKSVQIREENAQKAPKGKGPSEIHLLEVIQEQLVELTRSQRLQMTSIRQLQEEAAQQRIYTPGVRNEPKGYRAKGPTRDPVEESTHEDDKPSSKATACAYCSKKGHTAQECRKLKADQAKKPESAPQEKPKPKKPRARKAKEESKTQSDRDDSSDSSSGNELTLQLTKAGGGPSKPRKGKKAQAQASSQ